MNEQAIQDFRKLISRDSDLQARFFDAYRQSPAALASLAQQNGFDVTAEDVNAAVDKIRTSGELTDVELELVSGGGVAANQGGVAMTGNERGGEETKTTP